MLLSFRQRIFWILIVLGTVPTALALLALATQLRSTRSPAGPRAALETVAATGREAMARVDTSALDPAARQAFRAHAETLSRSLTLARRADVLARYTAGVLAAAVLGLAALLVAASVRLAGHLSRQLSRPMLELVQWAGHIERREPLPAAEARGAPEFAALRGALRGMAVALDEARRQELETERLRAFREVARSVAHELRGPITSMRLALAQLEARRASSPESDVPLEVLADEAGRLEGLAREFSEVGRLPEGPAARVDVLELLEDIARAGVADSVGLRVEVDPGLAVHGHYEPLRRAVVNLVRNAAEASDGEIVMTGRGLARDAGQIELAVIDHGPGVPADLADHLFEPYVTSKASGTGLGLTLVRQAAEADGGSVRWEPTSGGGATFVITLPAEPEQ
jgi:signal transduction histidine kinase